MATSKEYLSYIMGQFSGADGVSHRAMMGEYVVYVRGKVMGGLYDNRLLVKPTPSARALLPDAPLEPPYPGAKPMLVVEETDDRALLSHLANAMYDELPQPKPRKTSAKR